MGAVCDQIQKTGHNNAPPLHCRVCPSGRLTLLGPLRAVLDANIEVGAGRIFRLARFCRGAVAPSGTSVGPDSRVDMPSMYEPGPGAPPPPPCLVKSVLVERDEPKLLGSFVFRNLFDGS